MSRRARRSASSSSVREALTVPVVTWDERFTSSLADGDDARAAAYILSSYLEWLGTHH